jgi:hypothetical protein
VTEGAEIQLSMIDTNVFNHLDFAYPTLNIGAGSTTAWGVANSQGNTPRAMQFGLRIRY